MVSENIREWLCAVICDILWDDNAKIRATWRKPVRIHQGAELNENFNGWPAERRECTHPFANQLIILPDAIVWNLDTYICCTSTYRQFIICMFYMSKFHTKQDFVFKYHILQFFLYNAYGTFKIIVGVSLFTPFCREQAKHSHCQFSCQAHVFMSPSAGHTTIDKIVVSKPENWGGGEADGYLCSLLFDGGGGVQLPSPPPYSDLKWQVHCYLRY